MRAAFRVGFLLACCFSTIGAQTQGNGSHGSASEVTGNSKDESIHFKTKAKDACVMVYSDQGDSTKLRVSCQNEGRSYWCDFLGKPNLCRSYNKKPHHYFNQIMWEMRKLQNACQGLHVYKPRMCHSETDEAQMVLHRVWPKVQKQPGKPGKNGSKPGQPRRNTKSTTPRPTEAAQSAADHLARQYCWESIQLLCAYFISWFE